MKSPFHQTVSLRSGVGTPLHLGDEASQEAWHQEASAIQARMVVAFEVAPGVSLASPRGVLVAGNEIRLDDLVEEFDGVGRLIYGRRQVMKRLVNSGKVLARDGV